MKAAVLVGLSAALVGLAVGLLYRRPAPTGDYVVVFCTVPSKELGAALSQALLQAGLVACVNILPGVESHFVWQGKVEVDQELLLMIKTRSALVPRVTAHIRQQHTYDEPEVIAVPITGGSQGYLDWVRANTAGAGAASAAVVAAASVAAPGAGTAEANSEL